MEEVPGEGRPLLLLFHVMILERRRHGMEAEGRGGAEEVDQQGR